MNKVAKLIFVGSIIALTMQALGQTFLFASFAMAVGQITFYYGWLHDN